SRRRAPRSGPAWPGRLRGVPTAAHERAREGGDRRDHGLRTGRGPAPLQGRRLRLAPGEARAPRRADQAGRARGACARGRAGLAAVVGVAPGAPVEERAASCREAQRAIRLDHERTGALDRERGALARRELALAVAVEREHARTAELDRLAGREPAEA